MNIIKSDSRCHRYRIHPMFSHLYNPSPPKKKPFPRGKHRTNKQVSNQTNKANLLTLKTAGQKALIAGYMRLFSLDEVMWLKSKAIKTSTTIRRLK